MSTNAGPDHKPNAELRAEDIAALGELLGGIVQARLPIEAGLAAVGAQWPGRAGDAVRQLMARLQQGQSLERALTELGSSLPIEFAALVRAGQHSGRLPEMLDDLARLARLRQESRRLAVVSMIYPLIVALVASLLGLFVFTRVLPVLVRMMLDFRIDLPNWLLSVGRLSERVSQPLTPVVWAGLVAVGLLVVVLATYRMGHLAEKHAERIPLLGKAWRDARLAYWSDLMAVLLEHGTPEAEAVELAAQVSGLPQMIQRMGAVTTLLRAGHQPTLDDWKRAGVPVLGAWAVTWPGPAGDRVSTLRLMAQSYARQARDRMILTTSLMPVLALVLIGGLFTLVYGMILFLPLTTLYRSLS